MGDLDAQITACNLGLKRLEELFQKYGEGTVTECIERIFAESETHCRQVIAEFADGTYEFETEFDDSAAAQDGSDSHSCESHGRGQRYDDRPVGLLETAQQRDQLAHPRRALYRLQGADLARRSGE